MFFTFLKLFVFVLTVNSPFFPLGNIFFNVVLTNNEIAKMCVSFFLRICKNIYALHVSILIPFNI